MTFRSDVQGQVIRRDESDNQSGGDPHEIWYRFGGRQIGYVGNNGSLDIDYAATDVERSYTAGAGAFENGATTSTSYADFDQAVAHINSFYQGSRAGSYTAQAGETFSSIAATLWGDGSLWYKLAQANGASSDEPLTAGEIINIPTGVMRSTNTATTFIPYDPADITGNTSPTAVKPPKNPNNHCGVMGQILLSVIATAVALIVAPYATAAIANMTGAVGMTAAAVSAGATVSMTASVVGGAITGAVSSIASQAVGVATGIQDKFSWGAVAMAAIGGGVGGGLGKALPGNAAGMVAARGALGSAITQGIGMATGLQSKFSWASVAAAGVGGWVAAKAPGPINGPVAVAASGIARAATRSLIDGSDFGDNLIAALPDVVGSIVGSMIAGGIASWGDDANAAGDELDEFMLDTYGANAAASVPASAMSDPAAISAAISTAYGLRLDDVALADPSLLQAAGATPSGQGLTAVSARPGRVLGDDRFVSLPIDPDVAAYVVSDQHFQLGHGIADGQAWWFFVNDQGQISTPHAAWANQQTANSWIVPEINGAVAIAPLNQDFVRQALDETIFTIGFGGINGARAVANGAAYAWNNPVGAGQAVVSALGTTGREIVNQVAANYGLAPIQSTIGYRMGQAEGARIANAWQTGTMGRYAGSLIGGAVLAEAVPIPGLPRSACFVAGTLIHTRDGLKPIEEITLQDFVLSRPEADGEQGERRVVNLIRFDDKPILEIVVAAAGGHTEIFQATGEHPFWVEGEGWVAASELKADDRLRLANGNDACIASVTDTGTTAPVFNFEVDGWHTYHVGELGVWVHNADCFGPRNLPGVVTVSGELVPQAGRWLDAATPAPIPPQVAADLAGREFANFGQLRSAVWESIANNPQLRTGFGAQSLGNMRGGFAPFAPLRFQTGLGAFNQRFNLHHIKPIGQGGAVYDLSNIQIVSPRVHRAIHGG